MLHHVLGMLEECRIYFAIEEVNYDYIATDGPLARRMAFN